LGGFFVWQLVKFGFDMVDLLAMHRFYTHLLNVPEVRQLASPYASPPS